MNRDVKGRLVLGWIGLVPMWVVCWIKMGDLSGWESSLCFATPLIILSSLLVLTLSVLLLSRLGKVK